MGFIDSIGNAVIPAQYDDAYLFNENWQVLKKMTNRTLLTK